MVLVTCIELCWSNQLDALWKFFSTTDSDFLYSSNPQTRWVLPILSFLNLFFISFFFLFRATLVAHGGPQARGWIGATAASLQQCQIWAVSVTYTIAHGNAGSVTHWVRSGIELATSWFLVRFVSAVPEWELLGKYFKVCFSKLGICFIIPLEYMQNFD